MKREIQHIIVLLIILISLFFINEYYPTNEVKSFEHHGNGTLYIHNDYIYIADMGGMVIFEIIKTDRLTELCYYKTPRNTHKVITHDNIAYVLEAPYGNQKDGLYLMNITDPSNPTEISNLSTPGVDIILSLNTKFLYIISRDIAHHYNWNGSLTVINLSEPTQPFQEVRIEIEAFPQDVIINNNKLFIAAPPNGLIIYDIANQSQPIELDGISIEDDIYEMKLYNDIIYAITEFGKIYSIDTLGNDILSIFEIPKSSTPLSVSIYNDLLFISQNDNGGIVRIFNISNPNQIRYLGFNIIDFTIFDIEVVDNYVYLMTNYYIIIYSWKEYLNKEVIIPKKNTF